jgi:hypothetical protein
VNTNVVGAQWDFVSIPLGGTEHFVNADKESANWRAKNNF